MKKMKGLIASIVAASTLGIIAVPVMAQSVEDAVKARKADMQLRRHYLMLLGGMAQGKVPYDAEKAQKAADSLKAMLALDRSRMWVADSDSMSIDGTRAKPEIWDNFSDFVALGKANGAAIMELAKVAGQGLDVMRPAVGKVGQTCSACHKKYRDPEM